MRNLHKSTYSGKLYRVNSICVVHDIYQVPDQERKAAYFQKVLKILLKSHIWGWKISTVITMPCLVQGQLGFHPQHPVSPKAHQE